MDRTINGLKLGHLISEEDVYFERLEALIFLQLQLDKQDSSFIFSFFINPISFNFYLYLIVVFHTTIYVARQSHGHGPFEWGQDVRVP